MLTMQKFLCKIDWSKYWRWMSPLQKFSMSKLIRLEYICKKYSSVSLTLKRYDSYTAFFSIPYCLQLHVNDWTVDISGNTHWKPLIFRSLVAYGECFAFYELPASLSCPSLGLEIKILDTDMLKFYMQVFHLLVSQESVMGNLSYCYHGNRKDGISMNTEPMGFAPGWGQKSKCRTVSGFTCMLSVTSICISICLSFTIHGWLSSLTGRMPHITSG